MKKTEDKTPSSSIKLSKKKPGCFFSGDLFHIDSGKERQ